MIVIKRNGSLSDFNQLKVKSFINTITSIEPKLHNIDVNKVVTSIERGLTEKNTADDILSYSSTVSAGFASESYDYCLLAGRIEAVLLHRTTPPTFNEAMNRISDLLQEDFLKKVNAFNYDGVINHENDYTYDVLALKTLKRSYLLRDSKGYVERPQYMLMRVAIFLTDTVPDALDTYKNLSSGTYTHASPTLYNSGMKQHQLASCFLLAMKDDAIEGIFDTIKDTALISKSAGGIGIHASNIRAKGTPIKGTNGYSNGLVPMLRVLNNTARYVDQGGGKRKGAFAIFMEPWHADIFDILDLKLNHGDENARARDLFYSLWIPDLFMERVKTDSNWTLFCPKEYPGLQDCHGEEFKRLYEEGEQLNKGKRIVKARDLWQKICNTQIETGTPYLMYKDACNSKSNQKHLGTIKSSNLCAEIVEYSSPEETAVCTLASVALPKCVDTNGFNFEELIRVTQLVTKNLNSVIDKTSYPIETARTSNTKHRPIGIGVQGLHDVFQMLSIPFDSDEAADLNKKIFETMYYAAVDMSVRLAREYGPHESFKGSPASLGQFQFDLWNTHPITWSNYDWEDLRHRMRTHGMRNSLLIALMPTASSAQILGNTESIEPRTSNMYVRRVTAGEFVVVNKYLEAVCRKQNLWNEKLIQQIVENRGSIQNTDLPDSIKKVYKTVWEISQKWLIDLSAGRAKYVCQSQSLNLYLASPTYSKLSSMHFYAYDKGLKTGQYYLRTQPKANNIAFTVKPTVDLECEFESPVESGYTIYGKSNCKSCKDALAFLPTAHYVNCDSYLEDVDEFLDFIWGMTPKQTPNKFPMIFYNKSYIGGYSELTKMDIDQGGECTSCHA